MVFLGYPLWFSDSCCMVSYCFHIVFLWFSMNSYSFLMVFVITGKFQASRVNFKPDCLRERPIGRDSESPQRSFALWRSTSAVASAPGLPRHPPRGGPGQLRVRPHRAQVDGGGRHPGAEVGVPLWARHAEVLEKKRAMTKIYFVFFGGRPILVFWGRLGVSPLRQERRPHDTSDGQDRPSKN